MLEKLKSKGLWASIIMIVASFFAGQKTKEQMALELCKMGAEVIVSTTNTGVK